MPPKEAKARIKINQLLQESGWRLIDDSTGTANVVLENNMKITHTVADNMGEDYEKTTNGFADYLLLDERGFPLIVLEAKSEDKNPLAGKEQARKYARTQNCGYVILSNGNIHYFWDIEKSNPSIITKYPTPQSIKNYSAYKPQPERLINEKISEDYIVLTQKPNYSQIPEYQDPNTRDQFNVVNKLRFLRKYQVEAVRAIQDSVRKGNERFLFEMATGTGKTLVSAAVIKLFLRTGNANRVLFLVDRLELETQAEKAFKEQLKNDRTVIIYKENRDDWRRADIVVTTVQSLLFNNKFTRLFSPVDFDLVISDEAHRSIGGNARALFEYFIGYKLGLTATPKDYPKRFDAKNPSRNDPREYERRLLMDTYRTFGCESGTSTFRYSLVDGVNEGFLINPVVVDARTNVTTQLLSDKGYAVFIPVENEGESKEEEQSFFQKDFEKKFFSDDTNAVFCKAFLDNAFRDPISREIGKVEKKKFKLFDFFGNYEYFEEKFQYDQVLKLPALHKAKETQGPHVPFPPEYENFDQDTLHPVNEIIVGLEGMKVDRMFFDRFGETVKKDEVVLQSLEEGNWDKLLDHINREILNKPEDFYTIEKLRRSIKSDRCVTMREIVEYIFGLIPFIKSKEELLDEEFSKFIADCKPGEKDDIIALKYFFKSYLTDAKLRDIIDDKKFAELNVNSSFTTKDLKAIPERWRHIIPEYIKDYVPLNKFTN